MHKQPHPPFGDLTYRAPTMDDAQRVYELMVRCDIDEYGEPDADLDDLTLAWGRIDLAQDAWLVITPAGDLLGYGAVLPWRAGLQYDIYVEPSWEGSDLGQALMIRCATRGHAMAQARAERLTVKTYVPHVNLRSLKLVEQAGFQFVKYIFQMEIRLDVPPPAPRWPRGISIRTAVPGQDDRALHHLVESAFARPGRTATTFAEWQELMMRSYTFRPDLWFLATAGDEIIGVCLSFSYSTLGWVRQLAVAEGWRCKGIGTALLRHAFGVFRERGYDRAGLTVDSENPNAYAFYQRVGMRRVRQYDEYEKRMKG